MSEKLHLIDTDRCHGDGICVEVCPQDCLEISEGKAATIKDSEDNCIFCGQCVAVCPYESISMPKIASEDFHELPKKLIEYDEFFDFLKTRRSIRLFKNKPVEKEVIDKILQAASTAPMGMPPHSTEVLVIDQKEEMEFLLKALVKEYDFLIKGFSNPLSRLFIRLSSGKQDYKFMKEFILDLVIYANNAFKKDGTDKYIYKAPLLMVFHGSRKSVSYEENAHLVCHHAMLAAVSLGLGTTIIGMAPLIIDSSKALRKRYDIPKDNKVITSLIIGYPKYKYKKSIKRNLASVRTY